MSTPRGRTPAKAASGGGSRSRGSGKRAPQPAASILGNPAEQAPADAPPADNPRRGATPTRASSRDVGERRVFSIDIAESVAARVYGLINHIVQTGPIEDIELQVDFWVRATDELLEKLQDKIHDGEPFERPKVSRLPRGERGGAWPPGEAWSRFTIQTDPARIDQVKGFLLYTLNQGIDPGQVFGIGSRAEFFTVAADRLLTRLEKAHGGPWDPPARWAARSRPSGKGRAAPGAAEDTESHSGQ
jgi:hypothetical protein